jgi:hypothetical protein
MRFLSFLFLCAALFSVIGHEQEEKSGTQIIYLSPLKDMPDKSLPLFLFLLFFSALFCEGPLPPFFFVRKLMTHVNLIPVLHILPSLVLVVLS